MLVNFLTAHLGLKRRGRLASGESVRVHGAAGGVGTASIQVAKALGAGLVIAVGSTEAKREAALAAGADHAPGEDWVPAVKELSGSGADVVVDPFGGYAFDPSLKCMKPFGRLLVVGFASGRIPQLPVNRLLLRHLDVVGVNYGGVLTLENVLRRGRRRAAALDRERHAEPARRRSAPARGGPPRARGARGPPGDRQACAARGQGARGAVAPLAGARLPAGAKLQAEADALALARGSEQATVGEA